MHMPCEERLERANIALTLVQNNTNLGNALIPYGYTAERIAEGRQLYNTAVQYYQGKIDAYGSLRGARNEFETVARQAYEAYMQDIQLARVALAQDNSAQSRLLMIGPRKKTRAGWLSQAHVFYTAALENTEISQRLAAFTLTRQRLEAGAATIAGVTACYVSQREQRGFAEGATSTRDQALTTLDEWMRDFFRVARVALKNQPQMLEQMGVR